MYQVGTQVGDVHQQRQGTGKATVLQDTEQADDYFLKYMGARAAADEAKAAKKEAERAAALGKIMSFQPDYFAGHHQEIAEQTRIMQEAGLAAMNAGVADPAVGSDAASQAYQRELTKLNQMSTISKQFKDAYTKFKQDVDGKAMDYFDTDSLAAGDQYFRTKIADVMADPSKIQSPPLKQAKVYASLIEGTNAIAAAYNTATADGVPLDEKRAKDIVRETMVDPAKGPGMIESAQRSYEAMPAAMQEEIKLSAQGMGITVPEAVMLRFSKQKFESQAPYNPGEEAIKLSGKLDLSTSGYTGAETFSEGVNAEKSLQSATALAKAALFAHPDALTSQAERLGVKQGALSYEEFVDKTARAFAKDIYAMKAKDTKSGILSGSGKNPEKEKRADDWLQTLFGPDNTKAQQAADVLRGIDFGQGLTLDRAYVIDDKGLLNGKIVRFALKGDIKAKLSKKEIADVFGAPESAVKEGPTVNLESGQVEQEFTIPLTPRNSQFLRTFYDDAEKSKRSWQGADALPTYAPPATVEDIYSGQGFSTQFPNQTTPAKTTTYKY